MGAGIFENATVDTNILIAQKCKYIQPTKVAILTSDIHNLTFKDYLLKLNELWNISNVDKLSIKEKIEQIETRLSDFNVELNYGILTGANKTFILSKEKAQELINLDYKNQELIKPILRGKDLERYSAKFNNVYLLCTHNGVKSENIPPVDIRNDYPTLIPYFESFGDDFKNRGEQGDTYFNLRNCAYIMKYLIPKIIYADIVQETGKFYLDEDGYYTEYGRLNGKLKCSEKVFVEPKNVGKKNETKIHEQAILEAKSIIDHKLKSENYVLDIANVDTIAFQPPMLAKEYESYNKNMEFIQPKLDGVRCNIFNGKAISRRNKPFYSVNHIIAELNIPDGIHLDGELYNHSLKNDFNKIVSLVKKERIDDDQLKEIESLVEYHIYDMWDDNNPHLTFSKRNEIINRLFSGLNHVKIVPTFKINSEEELEQHRIQFIEQGYEGAILRLIE